MRVITSWDDLRSLVGTTTESAALDFKEDLRPDTECRRIELAKDIAALANVLGGHLLVGVETTMGGTLCTGFRGLEEGRAAALARAIEEQAGQRCSPSPVVAVLSIAVPGTNRIVLVASIGASPVAPVGVRLRQTSGGCLVDQGWAFPYRVGSQTSYLQPDQFGRYESMTARRMAALLSDIPVRERRPVRLRWVVHSTPGGEGYGDGQAVHLETDLVDLVDVDLAGNVAMFERPAVGDSGDKVTIDVPLDQIRSVWRTTSADARWMVAIDGSIFDTGYWPPP